MAHSKDTEDRAAEAETHRGKPKFGAASANSSADDGGAPENIRAAVAETKDLNARSQPLGHAVTCRPGGSGTHGDPPCRRFTVHRVDHPAGNGPSFATAEEVRSYLARLEKLPRWRLDLGDDSVDFDSKTLTVTDKATGESFSLRGWNSFGIAGVVAGERRGRNVGPRHISVVAEKPPTIGRWYKEDTR